MHIIIYFNTKNYLQKCTALSLLQLYYMQLYYNIPIHIFIQFFEMMTLSNFPRFTTTLQSNEKSTICKYTHNNNNVLYDIIYTACIRFAQPIIKSIFLNSKF